MNKQKQIVHVDKCVFTSDRPDAKPTGEYVECELGEDNGCGQVYIFPPGQLQPQFVWKAFVKEFLEKPTERKP